MNSIEISAKTVKEATRLGLEQLNCDLADCDIEVLEMGSPGIFGIFGKPAKVRLTRKNAGKDEFDIDMPKLSLDGGAAPKKARSDKPAKQPQQKKEEKKPEAEAAAEEPKPERKSKPRNRRERKDAPKTEAPETVAAPVVEEEPFVATPEDQLSPSAVKARDFIAQLTQHMGAPVTMEIMETPEQLRVKMAGENMSMLIGRRGETLDSVQYLTSLCVNRGREDYLRVSLDTENYRAKREESLRKLAVRMANRAKKTGKRVALEPMNPYERRILHSALQNDPEVTTHSEGEEPYRRVIITLK